MSVTDYEQLAAIREAWPDFLRVIEQKADEFPGGARVVYSSPRGVPPCDPIALHEGELILVARREGDEGSIERDLASADPALVEDVFGPGVVSSFRVLGRDQGIKALGDALPATRTRGVRAKQIRGNRGGNERGVLGALIASRGVAAAGCFRFVEPRRDSTRTDGKARSGLPSS